MLFFRETIGFSAMSSTVFGRSYIFGYQSCRKLSGRAEAIQKRRAEFVRPWVAPEWVPSNIPNVPTEKVQLASLPTPIERWFLKSFVDANPDYELFIKRDDQTGAALTGNKIRKLEFMLADATRLGATDVITCGMSSSNHCRATAIACAKLGLKCHLLLDSKAGLRTGPSRRMKWYHSVSGRTHNSLENFSQPTGEKLSTTRPIFECSLQWANFQCSRMKH